MMEPFKIKLHELLTIGCIIVTVTTAYAFLSADVKAIRESVVDLKIGLDAVQREQYRINFTIAANEDMTLSKLEREQIEKALDKKPWKR